MLGGCDVAKPDAPRASGPALHLVGVFPADGCGEGPDPDCTIATDASLTLRFDRFLSPATVNRQAIQVYSGDPSVSPSIPFIVDYDPVERVVEYRMPSGYSFAPRTLYQLELAAAADPGDFGIRAFDGAPLAEGGLPLHSSFFTGADPTDPPLVIPAPPSCDDVVSQVFGQLGSCAGSECHQKGGNQVNGESQLDAPYGLWLDEKVRFAQSAISRIAHQTELGDQSGGEPAEMSDRFGVRMALVDPHNSGGSYLLYKLLLGLENYEPCDGSGPTICQEAGDACLSSHSALPLPEGECIPPPQVELDRLREWFVRGESMPRAHSSGARGNVHLQGLRALSRFIAAGADCGQ